MQFCPDRFFAEANSAYCQDSQNLTYSRFLINYLHRKHSEVFTTFMNSEDLGVHYQNNDHLGEFVKFIYSQQTP